MDNIVVSVIVPIYKIEKDLLIRSLNALDHQSIDNYEVILVDDGSPDDCGIICDDYVETHRHFTVIHTKNYGVSHARNTGLKAAKGKYICFVDPDDYVENNILEILIRSIIDFSADLAICNFRESNGITKDISGRTNVYEKTEELQSLTKAMIGLKISDNIVGSPWGKIYRKEIIERNNCYFNEKLPRSQDNEFNFRYMQYVNKCVFVDMYLYNYTVNPHSAMRKYWSDALYNAKVLIEIIQDDINNTSKPEVYSKAFSSLVFGKIEDVLYTNLAHPDNSKPIRIRVSEFKEFCSHHEISIAIENYDSQNNGLYRKLLSHFLKNKRFLFAILIAEIRLKVNSFRQ